MSCQLNKHTWISNKVIIILLLFLNYFWVYNNHLLGYLIIKVTDFEIHLSFHHIIRYCIHSKYQLINLMQDHSRTKAEHSWIRSYDNIQVYSFLLQEAYEKS